MTMLSSGKVGIGTNAPGSVLDVRAASLPEIRLSSDATTRARLGIATIAGNISLNTLLNSFNIANDSGALHLSTSSASPSSVRMTIDTSGNVGIGTSSPTQRLEVAGNMLAISNNNNPYIGTGDATTDMVYMQWNSTAKAGRIQTLQGGGGAGNISIQPLGGNVGIGISAPLNTLAVSPVQYSTGTASQSTSTITGSGTTFTSGMVGSQFVFANGTSAGTITAFNSATSLTVSTSQTVSSQNYTVNYTGLNVTSSGNVGIGTTSPGSTLDVKGHVANSGTAATVGTCGTSPAITGNDNRGSVTNGTGAVSSCVITFNSAYATAPFCVVSWNGTGAPTTGMSSVATTTTLTVYFSVSSPSAVFNYQCTQ